jgi:hypothetical protein
LIFAKCHVVSRKDADMITMVIDGIEAFGKLGATHNAIDRAGLSWSYRLQAATKGLDLNKLVTSVEDHPE